MKVILLERIGRTGAIGDEVSVKDGFARNFLLPQGKALRATAGNRQKFEGERAHIEKRNDDRKNAATGIAEGLNGREVVIIRQAGETGQLYGSVASRDVVEALAADGFTIQRSQVDLADPIMEKFIIEGGHPLSGTQPRGKRMGAGRAFCRSPEGHLRFLPQRLPFGHPGDPKKFEQSSDTR